jgi:hypothetical protein
VIRSGDREWRADAAPGAAAPGADEPDADTSGAGVLTLTVDPFELGRALSGRRSVDQIRAFDWSADPGPHLAAFTWGPFTVRETPLVE